VNALTATSWLQRNRWHLAAIVALLALQAVLGDTVVLPLLAVAAFAFSVARKIVRTGKLTRWALLGEPEDRIEALLRMYAVPVLVASIVIVALRQAP
jgi:hypothetical protein